MSSLAPILNTAFVRAAQQLPSDTRPDLTFQLTPIRCGLASYRPEQIEPMFASAPTNVLWPTEWR